MLIERSKKSVYKNSFFNHLDDLKQFDFLSDADRKREDESFGMADYMGLGQFIIENTTLVETTDPAEIDWDAIDNLKDKLQQTIFRLLGPEKYSDTLKPIVDFTIESFENYAKYSYMHPDSIHNPWLSTHEMLLQGYIYLISDQEALKSEFKFESNGHNDKKENIGLITRGKKEDKFRGVVLDNRFRDQNIVLEYLKDFASGYQHARSKAEIKKFLDEKSVEISSGILNTKILLPLKRAGLIGSSSKGFYYIITHSDLKQSYDFHKSKYIAIKKTLDMYAKRASVMNIML